MASIRFLFVVLAVAVTGLAQAESTAELVARIRAGGWLEQAKYRRGSDGGLEILSCAVTGDPARREFVPIVGPIGDFRFENLGGLGLLALVCHGDSDLLAMTDADLHFTALGVGATNEELRQFLVVPPPPFAGPVGRAALLDRLLAIDRLQARDCRAAIAELNVVVGAATLPEALRNRARDALRAWEGKPVARARLDASQLLLPAAFDACIVVEHARLPDMRWVVPLSRRTGVLVTAHVLERAGGELAATQLSGAQRMVDFAAEAPFWLAQHWGNARLDHSCVVVTMKPGAEMPVAITWQAAGAIEAEGWAQAKLPDGAAANNPLLGGTLEVTATGLFASTDGTKGRPRPARAEELLREQGHGLRVVVPANSKLWAALAFLGLPPAEGAELRVQFGDPAVLVLAITARDEDAAEAWAARGKKLLAEGKQSLAELVPPALAGCAAWMPLCEQFFAAKTSVKGDAVFLVAEIAGCTPAALRAIGEALASTGF